MMIALPSQEEVVVLVRPTLHEVVKYFRKIMVGEDQGALSVLTNWVFSDQNVLIAGPRSTGKTCLMMAIADLTPQHFAINYGSTKAIWYLIRQLNEAERVLIPEANQVPQDLHCIMKLWGEGRDAEYNVTQEDKTVRTIKLARRPFLLALADENEFKLGPEMFSRLTVINTDSSIVLNKRVMQSKAEKYMGKRLEPDDEFKQRMRRTIASLPKYDELEFYHPCASLFVNAIPPFFSDCRRDVEKYFANTFGITRYHVQARYRLKDGRIVVEPSDMWLNHQIYGNILITTTMKCSDIERGILTCLIQHNAKISVGYLQNKVKQAGFTLSQTMLTTYLNNLADIGYVNKEKENKEVLYEASPNFEDFSFQITWQDVLAEYRKNTENHPEVPTHEIMLVQNPFSGETVNLNNEVSSPIRKEYANKITQTITPQEKVVVQAPNNVTTPLKEWPKEGLTQWDADQKFGVTQVDAWLKEQKVFNINGVLKWSG